MSDSVQTTCPYCGVGCGVMATPDGNGGVGIQGDPDHPANRGLLCSKGSALGETVGLEGRLLHPEIRGRRVAWFKALDEVAAGFRSTIEEFGPDSVAFYVSGQLLTEDYYVANKLMKGFIGSANIDTNSRLCMASAVAGHKRAFGEDIVPGCYGDLDQAELIVLVGANTAWCHPIVFRRIAAARERGAGVVCIDPRRTATTDQSDLHLPIEPGTDGYLFNGLLAFLADQGYMDEDYLHAHTEGAADALTAVREATPTPAETARLCGLREGDVVSFFQRFAATERAVTMFSQGVNQSASGTDKVNAIINCHLLTGRIARPGMGPFSITGQPNAMGGREVGGLANTLAAHRGFEHADAVQAYWGSPAIARRPGLKAVDLFDAVTAGEIRALWIMATNPVVSMPDADRVRRALKDCPFVVVSDVMRDTDTTEWADVRLPAAAWGEKDGTVTNSERRISRQRPFRAPPGEARPDWWIVSEVGRRLGFAEAFDYHGPAAIFDEHARLSGLQADRRPVFDISGLGGMDGAGYDALAPIQWPVPQRALTGTARIGGDGEFPSSSGRARLVPVTPRGPASPRSRDYPLALNTGRLRDHWHTMTRTGLSPRLSAHIAEPLLAVHPRDLRALGLTDGTLARVRSARGTCLVRVQVSTDQPPGSVFMPIHWSERYASSARVGALVQPEVCPISGEPEFKHTPVAVEPAPMAWFGFLLTRRPVEPKPLDYWVRVNGGRFARLEMAGRDRPEDWSDWARTLMGVTGGDADWLEYQDASAGIYRAAWLEADVLQGCLFAAPGPQLPDRDWLAGLFAGGAVSEDARRALLMGGPSEPGQAPGALVCSCFGIGEAAIRTAIEAHGLSTAEAVGERLGAGTNCGSCVAEIRKLLK